MRKISEHARAVIIGTAVGDSIGLPREGLSRRRARRLFGGPPLQHRLILGRGMCSDDTEHTYMVAQALITSRGDPDAFGRSLGWRLRWWFLSFPAGVGMATAKACMKLWIGFPPSRSGVWSAGNGPAMRAAILGVYAAQDVALLRALVSVSTRITHTDLAAEHGALAVALAASLATRADIAPQSYLSLVRSELAGTEILRLIEKVVEQIEAGATLDAYLQGRSLDRGISGYVNHTVPAVLFAWLTNPRDFRAVVEGIVCAGGDADSTGAIAGALVALTAGVENIPTEWIDDIAEWPRSVAWLDHLADQLAVPLESKNTVVKAPRTFWPAILLRNLVFLIVVLAHGFRRLLPPY